MKVLIGASDGQLAPKTRRLLRRMLCPLTGLTQEIGFVSRSPLEPRVAVSGGDMAGVHVLRGQPPPRPGAYHIGGNGTTYEETIIATLGETIERYSHYMAVMAGRYPVVRASYEDMTARVAALEDKASTGRRVLVAEGLQYFSDSQLTRPGFLFSRLQPNTAIGWVSAQSLVDGLNYWAPAQLVLVGYLRQPEEPQFMVGVTTGTAAHTKLDQAFRRALLELIQLDSAMGHWYGSRPSVLLQRDARTRSVEAIIARHVASHTPMPRFYWLPNADLSGLAIACVIEGEEIPRLAVGLGCDLALERAMYKAFLEAVAVAQLAKVIVFRQTMGEIPAGADPGQIYDLDSNVGYYASQAHSVVQAKFGNSPTANPSDLPPDVDLGAAGDLRYLVDGFATTGKQLVFLDLTTRDIEDLGFCVVRVWSPDTISLPLPSAPPVMHSRFQAYGGVSNEAPHPYP